MEAVREADRVLGLTAHHRLARDYERLSETLAGWHWVAFLGLLLTRVDVRSA